MTREEEKKRWNVDMAAESGFMHIFRDCNFIDVLSGSLWKRGTCLALSFSSGWDMAARPASRGHEAIAKVRKGQALAGTTYQ